MNSYFLDDAFINKQKSPNNIDTYYLGDTIHHRMMYCDYLNLYNFDINNKNIVAFLIKMLKSPSNKKKNLKFINHYYKMHFNVFLLINQYILKNM